MPRNSAPGGFAYIWQSKWVGIIAIKNERTQIHFLSDVLIAVASLDLKVPNDRGPTRSIRLLQTNRTSEDRLRGKDRSSHATKFVWSSISNLVREKIYYWSDYKSLVRLIKSDDVPSQGRQHLKTPYWITLVTGSWLLVSICWRTQKWSLAGFTEKKKGK